MFYIEKRLEKRAAAFFGAAAFSFFVQVGKKIEQIVKSHDIGEEI